MIEAVRAGGAQRVRTRFRQRTSIPRARICIRSTRDASVQLIGGPHGDLRPASTGTATSNQAEKRASLFSFGSERKDERRGVRDEDAGHRRKSQLPTYRKLETDDDFPVTVYGDIVHSAYLTVDQCLSAR